MTQKQTVQVELNGETREWTIASNELLLNVLREQEYLTGTKYGCGIGECGACTVHIDGAPILSCLTLAVACNGKRIVTVEGLAREGELDPVQIAFLDHSAFQCGFCTPDMILMTRALLNEGCSTNVEIPIRGNCMQLWDLLKRDKMARRAPLHFHLHQ